MRAAAVAAVAVLLAFVVPAGAAAALSPSPPVRLDAAWGAEARLGGHGALRLRLRISPTSPVATDVRIFLPVGVEIATTKLAAATCRIPPADLEAVLRGRDSDRSPCPRNALVGTGEATATLRFDPRDDQPLFASGRLRLYNGVERNGQPGIAVVVDTDQPIVSTLLYAGYLSAATRPYGLRLRVQIPAIPNPPFGAVVALERMAVEVGSPSILYSAKRRGSRVYYRPGGLEIPSRCPRSGLPFRVEVRFADGTSRAAMTRTRCPRSPRR